MNESDIIQIDKNAKQQLSKIILTQKINKINSAEKNIKQKQKMYLSNVDESSTFIELQDLSLSDIEEEYNIDHEKLKKRNARLLNYN